MRKLNNKKMSFMGNKSYKICLTVLTYMENWLSTMLIIILKKYKMWYDCQRENSPQDIKNFKVDKYRSLYACQQ